jgi:quinoprotein glucose dehydrogenase
MSGTGAAPSLLGLGNRLTEAMLHETIKNGIGRMPAVQHISDQQIGNILAYMKDKNTGATANIKKDEMKTKGPVVAQGGAAGELATRSNVPFSMAGLDYPADIKVPKNRYYTNYGLSFPYTIKPPWCSISAYDLNTGKKIWTKPLGEDPQAVAKGFRNTGVPAGSQRNGIIVTSNGLLFATVNNGGIFAYDAATGELLWQGQTPLGIATMPSMYEIGGRVYLAINATTPQVDGWNLTEKEKAEAVKNKKKSGAYVVYALPNVR